MTNDKLYETARHLREHRLLKAEALWRTLVRRDPAGASPRMERSHNPLYSYPARRWATPHSHGLTVAYRYELRRAEHCVNLRRAWCDCDWCRALRTRKGL